MTEGDEKMKKDVCYLVCSVKDDLPVACCGTYEELAQFLDISFTTIWRMIKHRTIVRGLYVEKVLL